jgi:outer membrane lipoprotein-sorting protein
MTKYLSFVGQLLLTSLFVTSANAKGPALDVDRLVAQSENQLRGKTFQGKLTMDVVHGGDSRKMVMRTWSEGQNKTSIKILEPKKDKGTGNLRVDLNLWQYLAHVDKIVKIPPSMMLQAWMGSDFTNDDLVKVSNLSKDYTHQLAGHEVINKMDVARIVCIPKKDAPVAWGKVILWVTTSGAVPIKEEFYTESGELVKTMNGSDVRRFGTHTIPTTVTMKSAKKADSSTTIHYDDVIYDKAIDDSYFTQEFLRKPIDQ